MNIAHAFRTTLCLVACFAIEGAAATRPQAVLTNLAARVSVDLAGGSIGEFRLIRHAVNPLAWNTPRDDKPGPHGHFLCLDRWGPPSAAEGALGMPYHGEASVVLWNLETTSQAGEASLETVMTAKLPMAGFTVRRTIQLHPNSPVFLVRESVRNQNALGRMYNMVQHPTIAPPFLDETTLVDCNGRRGFAQGGALPFPEEPSSHWPLGMDRDGNTSNLRHLRSNPNPNVVSFVIEGDYGWVTACHPGQGLLLGYVWKTRDYPWVSLWRDAQEGKPSARGLEFGTTGLHQPFPILAQKPSIWERSTFDFLDAGQEKERAYLSFLAPIPKDFEGVESMVVTRSRIEIRERRAHQPRLVGVDITGLNGP